MLTEHECMCIDVLKHRHTHEILHNQFNKSHHTILHDSTRSFKDPAAQQHSHVHRLLLVSLESDVPRPKPGSGHRKLNGRPQEARSNERAAPKRRRG